jgi:adenylosuccinate lyase
MPFKRNPIQAEKIDSLGRALAQMPRLAWDNAAHSLLERTLDDSANRRTMLPESFLIADELLRVAYRLVVGLQIDLPAMGRNLARYAPFAASERVLMALVKAGADRQVMHDHLRATAMAAWQQLAEGEENKLAELLALDESITSYLTVEDLHVLMDASQHLGDAPRRARELAATIQVVLDNQELAP